MNILVRNIFCSVFIIYTVDSSAYDIDSSSDRLGVFHVTEEMMQIPQDYSDKLLKEEIARYEYGITFENYAKFQEHILKYPFSNREIIKLRKKVVKKPNGTYFLVYDKDMFALQIPSIKQDFYNGLRKVSVRWVQMKALKIKVSLDERSCIYDLASKLLFTRTQNCVVDIFRKNSEEKNGVLTFDLNSSMPEFIRENIYKFGHEHGPNCISNALCILLPEKKFANYYIDPTDATWKLYLQDYRFLKASESLQSGDYLLFFKDTTPWHAASYIMKLGERELVFTKNGYLASSPRVLQFKDYMEHDVYGTNGEKLNLVAFRKSTFKKSISYKQSIMPISKMISIYSRPLSQKFVVN